MKYIKKLNLNESLLTEKLARGLKPLLTVGSTITKKDGEDSLIDLSDKFDRIDDEDAGDIASHLDMAIELMQDGYSGDATKKLKQFNKACKDVLKGKSIKSAFESVSEGKIMKDLEKIGGQIDYLSDADDATKKIWKKAGVNPEDDNGNHPTIILYSYVNSWPETKKLLDKSRIKYKELEDPNSAGESFIVFNESVVTESKGYKAGDEVELKTGETVKINQVVKGSRAELNTYRAKVKGKQIDFSLSDINESIDEAKISDSEKKIILQMLKDPNVKISSTEKRIIGKLIAEGKLNEITAKDTLENAVNALTKTFGGKKLDKRYVAKYLKSIEQIARKKPSNFARDYGKFKASDWIEDVEYNLQNEGKLTEAKKFKPGDMWSNDFDYDGMLKYALKVNHKTPLKDLQKLHDSATDVNYHTPFSGLGNAIDWITDDGVNSKEGKDFMKQFHNDIKDEMKK